MVYMEQIGDLRPLTKEEIEAFKERNAGNQLEIELPPLDLGFMEGEVFVSLPLMPFKHAGLLDKQPPFEVTLPNGQRRVVITRP